MIDLADVDICILVVRVSAAIVLDVDLVKSAACGLVTTEPIEEVGDSTGLERTVQDGTGMVAVDLESHEGQIVGGKWLGKGLRAENASLGMRLLAGERGSWQREGR